jgi:hypothetical protein
MAQAGLASAAHYTGVFRLKNGTSDDVFNKNDKKSPRAGGVTPPLQAMRGPRAVGG